MSSDQRPERRYSFPPLERRGLILGFGASQLALLGATAICVVVVIRALPTLTGLLLATALAAAAGAGSCWQLSGRPPSAWLPVAARWACRRAVWPRHSDAPTRGTSSQRTGAIAPAQPPAAVAGIKLVEAPLVPGSEPLGVVKDLRAGTYAAVLAVRGGALSLLDQPDKERRLAAWGAVLAGLCRDSSPVHRLQWIERTVPSDREGLRRYVMEAAAEQTGPRRESYDELVGGAGPVGQHHEVLIVVGLRPRRRSGHASPYDVLRRELRLLQGRLDAADLTVEGNLGPGELTHRIRAALDPAGVAPGPPPGRPGSPWPLAADEGWSAYRSDGAWHATYWIAEWPRIEVGPDFLTPLLLGCIGHRTVSVTMAPIGPAEAARQVEAARTADVADEQLRRRAGFLATARHRRQAEGVLRREAELAEGHGEFRFSGYVTVTVVERGELDDACAEMEQGARQANLEVRRLYGQQQAAFTWTLPLGRGLA
jgi:hypothetical protein